MNEARRTLLTRYLGEEWKPLTPSPYRNPEQLVEDKNRTFTEPADFFALFHKMQEKGDWEEVCEILIRKWSKVNDYRTVYDFTERFTAYLLTDIERFCNMVGEWLEGRPE